MDVKVSGNRLLLLKWVKYMIQGQTLSCEIIIPLSWERNGMLLHEILHLSGIHVALLICNHVIADIVGILLQTDFLMHCMQVDSGTMPD